jgi:hypothetical protein
MPGNRSKSSREARRTQSGDGSRLRCLTKLASHAQLTIAGKRAPGDCRQKERSANAHVIAIERSVIMSNPKTELTDNTQKDPDEWVSGDDPMTGAQASYLKTLCEQAGTPEMYDDNLTKAQASKLIDEMRERANL